MKFIIALLVIVFGMVVFAKDAGKPVPKKVASIEKKDKVVPDKPLNTADLAEVDAWVAGKVKSGAMTKKQGEDAMKHAEALKKVMDSEKKPKKGEKHGN